MAEIGSGLSEVGKLLNCHHFLALFMLNNILSEADPIPFGFVMFQTFHELYSLIQTDLIFQNCNGSFDSLPLLDYPIQSSKILNKKLL
jgi:hypothetical protein